MGWGRGRADCLESSREIAFAMCFLVEFGQCPNLILFINLCLIGIRTRCSNCSWYWCLVVLTFLQSIVFLFLTITTLNPRCRWTWAWKCVFEAMEVAEGRPLAFIRCLELLAPSCTNSLSLTPLDGWIFGPKRLTKLSTVVVSHGQGDHPRT